MRATSVIVAAVALSVLALAAPASATSIVVNGSFETGTIAGWTDGGNTGWNSAVSGANAPGQGSFGVSNGAIGSFSLLSQTLATNAGTSYDISFWIQNDGAGIFNVRFDGVTIYSESGVSHPYTLHTLTAVATTGSTVLQLQSRDDPGFIEFDAISVEENNRTAAVPEPVTTVLVGTGLVGWLGRRAVARNRR